MLSKWYISIYNTYTVHDKLKALKKIVHHINDFIYL